ncbi:MAG: MoxR family ATPase, partial [Firmicutes bacterium]|nr:MoxR family ATPase [Bacillota bacterium]
LSIGYPGKEAQIEMLKKRQNADPIESVSQILSLEDVLKMQEETAAVHTADSILEYITDLTLASRDHEQTEIGISPRGAIYLDRMAKARAYLDGRDYVIPEDVQAEFADVCSHRLILTQKARLGGADAASVLADILRTVTVPDRRA